LQRIHYNGTGVQLKAIDYVNPDGQAHHILFVQPQVFMLTPEEVENYERSPVNWIDTGRAAIVSLGRSRWLESFNPYHLKECKHFRIMFYDEFLDVICREIRAARGLYLESASV
jgi:hypothetical protein